MKIENQRYWSLDYARLITAYLVVLGHVLPKENPIRFFYICISHAPVFIVSGMLHKNSKTIIGDSWKYLGH